MAKLPKLPHVKYVRAKGHIYAYFNTGQKKDGKPIYARMPSPSAPGFFDSYAAFKAGRTKRQKLAYTVASLIADYTRSTEFRSLAATTQSNYHFQLGRIEDRLGNNAANAVEPSHVRYILDNEDWGAATCNLFVAVIGALFAWGRARGKTTAEPIKDIKRQKTGEYEPWPEDVLEAALACDDDRVRLAVHLLYFTGQRLGDVCKLRWNNIRHGRIHLTQQKTRKRVSPPIARDLQIELDRTPRRGLTILTGPRGAMRAAYLRAELQAFTEGLGVKTVPHGLRKNAVNALLEAGCTIAEVASITGQSYGMVEHYAARVNTEKLGSAAIHKLELRRAE